MEDWKVQCSYKLNNGTLINVRAQTTDELSVLLEGIGDYATQITATGKLLEGVQAFVPLSIVPSTINTTPPQSFVATQPQAQSATQTQGGPKCVHGNRSYLSGISPKTGNPYAMWVCPLPKGTAGQCKPVN